MQREERLWKSSSRGYNQVTVRENLAKASSPNLGQPRYPHSAIWPTVMFLKGRTERALLSEGTGQHRPSMRENQRTWGDVKVQHSTTLLPAAGGPGCSWASRAKLFPQPNFRKHRHQEFKSLKPKEVCAVQTLQVSVPSPLTHLHNAPMEINTSAGASLGSM